MTVAEDIKTARDIVAKRWYKGGLTDGEGNVCALGALNVACLGSVHAFVIDNRGRREEARNELERHLPDQRWPDLVDYNDAESTTHEDIVNLFDKTLADLGAL